MNRLRRLIRKRAEVPDARTKRHAIQSDNPEMYLARIAFREPFYLAAGDGVGGSPNLSLCQCAVSFQVKEEKGRGLAVKTKSFHEGGCARVYRARPFRFLRHPKQTARLARFCDETPGDSSG